MAKQHHILAIPTTQAGHVTPLFELCRRLAPLDGFRVTFIVDEHYFSRLQERLASGRDSHIQLLVFPTELFHFDHPEPAGIEQVVNRVEPPVTCIVSDNFLGWTQDLANKLGIPRFGFGTTSALLEIIGLNIPLLIEKGFLPAKDDPTDERLVDFVSGISPHFRRTQLPIGFRERESDIYSLGKMYQRVREATCILASTVEELEAEAVLGWRQAGYTYLPVGPLIPALLDEQQRADTANRQECLQWLDMQRPRSVIYVAFGSQVKLRVQQVEKLATGLLNSKQPFLWGARKDFPSDAADGFYEGLAARISSSKRGMLVKWTPQAQVLQHEAVGGFLTHCGWNSTMEAACSGVPTLCWSCDCDQNTNSYIMVDVWRTGLRLCDGMDAEVSQERVEDMVRALMVEDTGSELRRKAWELKKAVAGVWKEGGSSWKNFHEFVDLIASA